MGRRNRQPAFATPQPQLGVIGVARITTNGTSITAAERYGCIKSVTLGGSAVFTVGVWPPQPFYTIGSTCTYSANPSIVNQSYTAATLKPNTFDLQTIRLNPFSTIVPPTLWVTMFGPLKKPIRGSTNGQAVNSTPYGPLDVIGMAIWSANTSAITNLRTYGVCKNVRYVSTGDYLVDIWPAQRFYTVTGSFSSDQANASVATFPGPTWTPNVVEIVNIGTNPYTTRNSQIGHITIFGFRPPLLGMGEAAKGLPKGRLGVLGIGRGSVAGSASIGAFEGYGNLLNAYAGGSGFLFQQNVFPPVFGQYPSKQGGGTLEGAYTMFSTASTDLAVSAFSGWNATLTTGAQPNFMSLQSIGINGVSNTSTRACQVLMNTTFGPIMQ